MMVHIDNDTDYNVTSIISSKPLQICLCQLNHLDTVYPGETFQISVFAVGQRNGTIPSRVVSIIEKF